MIQVTLYTRKDCHLCEDVLQNLQTLQSEIPHELSVVDIDLDKILQRKFGFEVPVIEVGPYVLKAPFNQQELRITLSAAVDRQRQLDALDNPAYLLQGYKNQVWSRADRFSYWLSRHYMLVFNLFVILYLGLPVMAPVLQKGGYIGTANIIYKLYGNVCHQLSFRSLFLFGEQYTYPLDVAGVQGINSFESSTGLLDNGEKVNLIAARLFTGNDQLGYKIALCQRDVAIYASILVFGLVFVLTGRKLPPLPWLLWILIGLVPIAVDGLSQLISQPPISLLPLRESTPFYRILTGGLFGLTTAWLGYPMVEETMRETRQLLEGKLRRIRNAVHS